MTQDTKSPTLNQPQDSTVVQFPNTPPSTQNGRLLYSLEAEQSVLGGLLVSDAEWPAVAALLSPNDFYWPEHQTLFSAAVAIKGDGHNTHIDYVTLVIRLVEEGHNKDWIANLVKKYLDNTCSAANLLAYARLVRKCTLNRQWEAAYNNRRPATEIAAIEDALFLIDNPDSGEKSMTLADFRQREVTPRKIILDPILTTHSETIVYAEAGVGKTLFITDLAFAIACGGHAIKWPVKKPRRVLIVDGEMPISLLMERYDQLVERNDGLEPEYMRIVSALDYDGEMDLIKPEWQAVINNIIEKPPD